MKVLQISTVCGSGSVGRITVDIYHTLEKQGDDCLDCLWQKNRAERCTCILLWLSGQHGNSCVIYVF